MNKKTKILASGCIAALLLSAWAIIGTGSTQGHPMKKDMTFVLGETVSRSGGLVVLQIIEIDESGFSLDGKTQTIPIDSAVTIVNVPVIKGAGYEYRFVSPSEPTATTNRFSIGSTTLPDDNSTTTLLYHHIDANPSWGVSFSRRVSATLQFARAHRDYICTPVVDVLVCDASAVLDGDIPE